MNLIDHEVHLSNGETIVIRIADDDSHISACPVCGKLSSSDSLPWDNNLYGTFVNGVEHKEVCGGPSFDICPCCYTQYGVSDMPDPSKQIQLTEIWNRLRQKWLAKADLTKEIIDQLKNLA